MFSKDYTRMKVRVLYFLLFFIGFVSCIMLKKECPPDEVHRSCSFYDEYTCWEKSDRVERVKTSPKRLQHCISGCFCKKGLVRQYPQGRCINVQLCRNRKIAIVMANLPLEFSGFSAG